MALLALGEKIKNLFKVKSTDSLFIDELEEILLASDIGSAITFSICEKAADWQKKKMNSEQALSMIRDELQSCIVAAPLFFDKERPNYFLFLGVNGVGKTSTIAKLCRYYRQKDAARPLLIAADTFRAAATEQLQEHGRRLEARVVAQRTGADPAAVVYDGIASGKAHNNNLLLIDTAGRMHNRHNLVRELQKIDKVVAGNSEQVNYRKILVLDATSGQNSLQQALVFNQAVDVDSIILTKYDSTAKGGIVAAIGRQLRLPVSFISNGECYHNLLEFNSDDFLDNLLAKGF